MGASSVALPASEGNLLRCRHNGNVVAETLNGHLPNYDVHRHIAPAPETYCSILVFYSC